MSARKSRRGSTAPVTGASPFPSPPSISPSASNIQTPPRTRVSTTKRNPSAEAPGKKVAVKRKLDTEKGIGGSKSKQKKKRKVDSESEEEALAEWEIEESWRKFYERFDPELQRAWLEDYPGEAKKVAQLPDGEVLARLVVFRSRFPPPANVKANGGAIAQLQAVWRKRNPDQVAALVQTPGLRKEV